MSAFLLPSSSSSAAMYLQAQHERRESCSEQAYSNEAAAATAACSVSRSPGKFISHDAVKMRVYCTSESVPVESDALR
jgi:hypothetical protein